MSRLEVDRSERFTSFLFFREDSREAGEALMGELQARRRLTGREMSRFVSKLEGGDFGFRFSKHKLPW